MELVDGTTVSMLMQGQSEEEGRTMRYDGTHATLYGRFAANRYRLTLHYHRTGEKENIPIIARDESGHGGGDFGIVRSFLNAMQGTPDESLRSKAIYWHLRLKKPGCNIVSSICPTIAPG